MPKIKNLHILVTGAGGFIGKVVVTTLLDAGFEVTAMVRKGSIVSFNPHENLHILRADIVNYKEYSEKVKTVDCIVHLAANKYHPKLSFSVNVEGAANLVRLVEEGKLRHNRIINMSSQSTKHKWKGVYGKTKEEGDNIIQSSKAEWTTIKPNLVYGPEDGTLFMTMVNYTKKLPFIPLIGNGKHKLFPVRVEDVAQVIVKAIENKKTIGKVYEIGSPKPVTFDQFLLMIQKELEMKRFILHVPFYFGLAVTWLATRVLPKFPISVDNILGSNQDVSCDSTQAIKDLNITLMPVKQGIKEYLAEKKATQKKVNVAVVGLGKMGILHSTILNILPNARITAVIDRDTQLGKTAQSMGVKANFYTSLDEALKKEKVDVVFNITPTFVHKTIIEKCLKHNIPFFVEKPVFLSANDFSIFNKAKKEVVALSATGYFWIFKREATYIKELLKQKKIGEIKGYTCTLHHSQVFGKKNGWQFDKKTAGGGVLINDGPHAISLLVHLFGKGTVKKAKMTYLYGNSVEDEANFTIQHKNGVQGKFISSWSVKDFPVLTIELEIEGTNGTISFKNNAVTVIKKGKVLEKKPLYALPSSNQVYNLSPRSGGDAYFAEDEEFIKNIAQKKPVVHNLGFAKDIESIITQAYETAEHIRV